MSCAALYHDRVTVYAREVARTGRYPDTGDLCGELHILACRRHLRDLERERTSNFPYFWDPDAATRVLDFAETLTLAEGSEPKPLRLMDCQAFDVGCTFGWKKVQNGARRFRQRYKSSSRQQGKTMDELMKAGWDVGVVWQDGRAFHGQTHIRLNLALPLSRVQEAFRRLDEYVFNA